MLHAWQGVGHLLACSTANNRPISVADILDAICKYNNAPCSSSVGSPSLARTHAGVAGKACMPVYTLSCTQSSVQSSNIHMTDGPVLVATQSCLSSTDIQVHLFGRAVGRIQYGLIRNIVCATAQVSASPKINQLEPPVIFVEDDVHWFHISVDKSSRMQCLQVASSAVRIVVLCQCLAVAKLQGINYLCWHNTMQTQAGGTAKQDCVMQTSVVGESLLRFERCRELTDTPSSTCLNTVATTASLSTPRSSASAAMQSRRRR